MSRLPTPPETSGVVKALGYVAVIVALVMGVFLMVPQEVPLVDANRQLLATSQAEGYCAGKTFGETRGYGDPVRMQDCLEFDVNLPTERDLDEVQNSFCSGLFSAAQFPVEQCIAAVHSYKLWPTMNGSITDAWNRRFPYPGSNALEAGTQDESRTGDRDELERSGDSR